jgi:hypothetical protein
MIRAHRPVRAARPWRWPVAELLLAGLAGLPLALPALADSLTATLAAMQARAHGALLG